jgi:hypothetical protein
MTRLFCLSFFLLFFLTLVGNAVVVVVTVGCNGGRKGLWTRFRGKKTL